MANRGSFEKRASRGPRMQDCRMRQSCPKGATAIVGRATPKPKYQPNPARKLSVPLETRARRLTECHNRSEITTKAAKYGVWCNHRRSALGDCLFAPVKQEND